MQTLAEYGDFSARLTDALRARDIVLCRVGGERIVTVLARAAADWLDSRFPPRARAVDAIARATGWHPSMIATGIDFVFGAVTEADLQRLVSTEAGSIAALSPPVATRRVGPKIVYHSLAGNVPGQGIAPIVASLLACSVLIVRDSARQPALTAGFREAIGRFEPDLAAMIVPVAWRRGSADAAVETSIVAAAERIELHGRDQTVAGLARRYGESGKATITLHGSRGSVGWVAESARLDTAARRFGLDVVMYEGRGCLTPHVIFVDGVRARADAFADALAHELDALEARWPRARGSIEEEASRRRFIDEAEVAALAAGDDSARTGADAAWSVRVGTVERIEPGPGLRCVRVSPFDDRSKGAVQRPSVLVAAFGVATDDEIDAIASGLRERCAMVAETRDCLFLPAGRMQAPPIDWRQDGCRRLGDLLGEPA